MHNCNSIFKTENVFTEIEYIYLEDGSETKRAKTNMVRYHTLSKEHALSVL